MYRTHSQIRMLGMWVGQVNPDHIWSKMWRVGPKGVRVKVVQGRPLASLAPKLVRANVFARSKYNKHNYAVYSTFFISYILHRK